MKVVSRFCWRGPPDAQTHSKNLCRIMNIYIVKYNTI